MEGHRPVAGSSHAQRAKECLKQNNIPRPRKNMSILIKNL